MNPIHFPPATRPRIGLALASGSARGGAHIGVIRALKNAGIEPDLVCGTSIGALVGAAYVGINHRGEPGPADVLVTPQLADRGLMAFHRAAIAIDAGRRAVEFALPFLQMRLNGANDD